MEIRKATQEDKQKAIEIAKELKDWFNEDAFENMSIDFKFNNTVVAVENKKVVGFLCHSSNEGIVRINWLGIDKNKMRKGVGTKLVKWLENKAKRLGAKTIDVETLTDKENYKPYEITRNFYKKLGFKKLYEMPRRKEGWDIQILMEKKLE